MSNAPALQEPKERRSIESYLRDDKVIKGLEAVATKYLTPDRMARIVVNAVRRTPKLAECNPQSVLGSVMLSCSLGLEPNTPMQQAHLIPYDKRGKLPDGAWGVVDTECQFIIGYRGYIALAKRNPQLIKLYAATIHEGDVFEHMEGSESFLKYQPALRDRGAVLGSFCFTKERGQFGDVDSATVLPMEEIEKIRSCSETYRFLSQGPERAKNDYQRKKAEEKLADTPWVKWFDEMAKKSAIRRHAKQLDLTAHLAAAVAVDEAADTGRLDMSKMMDAEYTRAVREGEAEPEYLEMSAEAEEQERPALAATAGGDTKVTQMPSRQAEKQPAETGGQAKADDASEKDSLASYAAEYGVKLDKRKGVDKLREEVDMIRAGTHPDLAEEPAGDETPPHDPETGEITETADGETKPSGDAGGGFDFSD